MIAMTLPLKRPAQTAVLARTTEPLNHHAVRLLRHLRSHRSQLGAHRGDAVAFFYAKLFGAGDRRLAFRHRRRHAQDRKFVDRLRDEFRANRHSLQRGRPDTKIRHRLAGLITPIEHFDVGPHGRQYIDQPGPGRVDPDVLNRDIRTGNNARADKEKCRR